MGSDWSYRPGINMEQVISAVGGSVIMLLLGVIGYMMKQGLDVVKSISRKMDTVVTENAEQNILLARHDLRLDNIEGRRLIVKSVNGHG